MKIYPVKGPGIVTLTGILIILIGMGALVPGFAPSASQDDTTEMKLDGGGNTMHDIPDVVYGTSFSISVEFKDTDPGQRDVTLYLLDEEDHEDIMAWIEENGHLGSRDVNILLKEYGNSDVLHTEHITGDDTFDVTTEYEGDMFLLIQNNGSEQAMEIEWESSQGTTMGVCFLVFLILGLVGVLVMKASRDIIE